MRSTPASRAASSRAIAAGDVVAVVPRRLARPTRRRASAPRSGGWPRCARRRAGRPSVGRSRVRADVERAPAGTARAVPGRQVVEDDDLVAGGEERLDRDRADVAGAAGDEDAGHARTIRGRPQPSRADSERSRSVAASASARSAAASAGGGAAGRRLGVTAGAGRSAAGAGRSPARPPLRARLGASATVAEAGCAAIRQDLLEPLDHPLRRRRSPGRSPARAGRARAPRARRRVRARPAPARRPRSSCADRPRRPARTASRPGRAARPTAPARPGAAARSSVVRQHAAWASSSSVGRSLSAGSAITRSSSASRIAPEERPRRRARARAIRSSPSTARPRRSSDDLGGELGVDPRAELVEPAGLGRQARTRRCPPRAARTAPRARPGRSRHLAMNRRTAASRQFGS